MQEKFKFFCDYTLLLIRFNDSHLYFIKLSQYIFVIFKKVPMFFNVFAIIYTHQLILKIVYVCILDLLFRFDREFKLKIYDDDDL